MATSTTAAGGWRHAWPDLLAFAVGLGMAWSFGWDTTDLVWSLWLASLVVGYATIVWTIFGPACVVAGRMWRDRTLIAERPLAVGAVVALAGVGHLFLLGFFTVHFGGFHFGHSVFLQHLFPIELAPAGVEATEATGGGASGLPGLAVYLEVVRRYWWWLPVAFVAERLAFRWPADGPDGRPRGGLVETTASGPRGKGLASGDPMMAPYKNVIRMHVLIFVFAGAQAAGLERSFPVYALVYAVYFFPWRLLRRRAAVATA